MSTYEDSVFLNVPFDQRYKRLFDSLVFAIYDCGFTARAALEIVDSGQSRVEKILNLIADCKFGIHDISRAGLDRNTGLPRFNMPLELGRETFRLRKGRVCLVLDEPLTPASRTLSPTKRGEGSQILLPACGEKVAEGRMRGA